MQYYVHYSLDFFSRQATVKRKQKHVGAFVTFSQLTSLMQESSGMKKFQNASNTF